MDGSWVSGPCGDAAASPGAAGLAAASTPAMLRISGDRSPTLPRRRQAGYVIQRGLGGSTGRSAGSVLFDAGSASLPPVVGADEGSQRRLIGLMARRAFPRSPESGNRPHYAPEFRAKKRNLFRGLVLVPSLPAGILFQHAFALAVDVQERICHAMLALRSATDVIIRKIQQTRGRGCHFDNYLAADFEN